jgi:hypothetical protein
MIIFKNPQNIEVFNSFVDQFEKVINQIFKEDIITICSINEQHTLFKCVANQNDPFATNTIMTPLVIAINEKVCLQLKLSQEEQHAMIAHEIGHILDKSPREINNQLNREYNADQFTIKLNLNKHLKTGLEKIIASGNYSEETEGLKERINKMSL